MASERAVSLQPVDKDGHPAGPVVQIEPYSYDYVDPAEPRGLGRFAFEVGAPARCWWYKPPRRPWIPVGMHYGKLTPPPLPRPDRQRTGDICGACGEPYWQEIHGYATGSCSSCYHSG